MSQPSVIEQVEDYVRSNRVFYLLVWNNALVRAHAEKVGVERCIEELTSTWRSELVKLLEPAHQD